MPFRNRNEAAGRLAASLSAYKGLNPLVLAIPRGAVPMAHVVAKALGGELDVVLVRKLRAPHQPELAIGSIDESGAIYVADYAERMGASPEYLEREAEEQLLTMRRRRMQYTPIRPPLDPAGRIVVVIDDGLATGATMISALHALRAKGPKKLVCAVPVAPPSTLTEVARYADEVVCLEAPEAFRAVGQFYGDFPQVGDDEVIATLRMQAA